MNMSLLPKNKTKLSPDEVNWLQSLKIIELDIVMVKRSLKVWEIRMDQSQFEIWMKERKIFKLFFNEASKGNPRVAGGGGVIICPEGNIETEYYWNIGNDTNNMAEAYGLWQGLKQLEAMGIEEAIVLGDSRIIIQPVNEIIQCQKLRLTRLIERILSISRTFQHLEFFHILRELNGKVDLGTNKAIA